MPTRFTPTGPLAWSPDDLAYAGADTAGHLRAVMISSLDGAGAYEGRSGPLSCPADRHLMRLLRATSDAVLVGAGTARDEDYGPPRLPDGLREWRVSHGMPPGPRLVLVSGRLALDPQSRMFEAWEGERPLVVTGPAPEHAAGPDAGPAGLAEVADVVRVPRLTPHAVLDTMRERGLLRTVCEGGPHWLRDLLEADLVDELWLTLSPVLTGGDTGRIVRGPGLVGPPRMALDQAATAEDFLFLRYVRPRG